MADETRRMKSRDEEEFEVPEDEGERGIAEDEEEFEDGDEVDEEEEEDIGEDRSFTSEIGSEGGSQGDMEAGRPKPRVMRGSEATTTAHTDERPRFDDRHEGGGVQGRH